MIEFYIGALLGGWVVLGLMFIAVFRMKDWIETKSALTQKVLMPLLYVFAAVGLVIDVVLNYWISPIFVEFPKKLLETVSQRMERYKKEETGYKLKFATWLCTQLNKHDKDHC